jgi:hypothetical protein
MVKVLKTIICRKPEDLRKLKHSTGIIFGRNIRKLEKSKGGKNDKTQ